MMSYAFGDAIVEKQRLTTAPSLKLTSPISADLSEMRVSLWPALVHPCRENLRRQQSRVRLFEIGSRFALSGDSGGHELQEIESLAGIATGSRWPQQWGSAAEPVDFYDVKSDVTELLTLTG